MTKQCYISKSLEGLDFKARYGLLDYSSKSEPLVIFGMYRPEDLNVYLNHPGKVILVWQGCDGKDLNPSFADMLKHRNAKHYAISHWISDSLKKYDIAHEVLPIHAALPNLSYTPLGDCVYFYTSSQSPSSLNYYGYDILQDVQKKIKHEIIISHFGKYSQPELTDVYKRCFINLRLTTYDGCPNTNLQMGMMGRKSIYNGDIPHSIHWKTVGDICESIEQEYERRREDHSCVSEDIENFMNIGTNWLNYGM